MTLQSSAVVPGGRLRLTVDGATPGDTVRFARGAALGDGGCPSALSGLCLEVTRGQPLGSAIADDSGHSELLFTLPEALPVGRTVAFQAFVSATDEPYASEPVGRTTTAPGNVLVILADDLGVDKIGRYGVTDAGIPPTPNLDRLMDDGVRFERAYTSPSCSPTRAILNTGRQPFQHGVGFALAIDAEYPLSYEETTIPEALSAATDGAYANAWVGKWHLGSERLDYADHPNLSGWDYFAGLLLGMKDTHSFDGRGMGYYDWERVENGAPERSSTYMTTHMVDDTLAQIEALPEPWVIVFAPFAPHAPYHWPPPELRSGVLVGATTVDRQYNATVETLDTEIGRLLDTIDPAVSANTTVLFMGDNGTPVDAVEDPFYEDRSKETVYEGGVHVPLIVAGPLVDSPGSASDALVHMADILPTVLDLAGQPHDDAALTELYGRSLVPWIADPERGGGREFVYAEMFRVPGPPPHHTYLRMIRDARWKLHQDITGPDRLYDMEGVLLEGEDLLADGLLTEEQEAAYTRLLAGMPTPME
jgi:arylsulfatase A-like enzyme